MKFLANVFIIISSIKEVLEKTVKKEIEKEKEKEKENDENMNPILTIESENNRIKKSQKKIN